MVRDLQRLQLAHRARVAWCSAHGRPDDTDEDDRAPRHARRHPRRRRVPGARQRAARSGAGPRRLRLRQRPRRPAQHRQRQARAALRRHRGRRGASTPRPTVGRGRGLDGGSRARLPGQRRPRQLVRRRGGRDLRVRAVQLRHPGRAQRRLHDGHARHLRRRRHARAPTDPAAGRRPRSSPRSCPARPWSPTPRASGSRCWSTATSTSTASASIARRHRQPQRASTSPACLRATAGTYLVFAKNADMAMNGGIAGVDGVFSFAMVTGTAAEPTGRAPDDGHRRARQHVVDLGAQRAARSSSTPASPPPPTTTCRPTCATAAPPTTPWTSAPRAPPTPTAAW